MWAYWAAGDIPQPIDLMLETWHKWIKTDDRNFQILSDSTVLHYLSPCDLPERFFEYQGHAVKADALRAALLNRYGGIWMDITTVVESDMINEQWDRLQQGAVQVVACADDDGVSWHYQDIYFVMTHPHNPEIEKWHKNILTATKGRISNDGLCAEASMFQSVDWSKFRWLRCYDYLALANCMWYVMALNDEGVRTAMETRWKNFPSFRSCMQFGNLLTSVKWIGDSAVDPKQFDRMIFEDSTLESSGIHKFVSSMELVKAFAKLHGGKKVTLEEAVRAPSLLGCTLRRAMGMGMEGCVKSS